MCRGLQYRTPLSLLAETIGTSDTAVSHLEDANTFRHQDQEDRPPRHDVKGPGSCRFHRWRGMGSSWTIGYLKTSPNESSRRGKVDDKSSL